LCSDHHRVGYGKEIWTGTPYPDRFVKNINSPDSSELNEALKTHDYDDPAMN